MKVSKTRTLLVGASGQVGHALAAAFADSTLVTASNRHLMPNDVHMDLGDAAGTQAILREVRPQLILVAGAMCNVDQCELQQDACSRINTHGPAIIAEYARGSGSYVVLFGTDHVFDGRKQSYVETDIRNPINAYARSKARAEDALRELLPDRHIILRTSWVYGPDRERRNYMLRLIDRLAAGETVTVPSDQWGSPTFTEDIAGATRHLVENDAFGTFHATGPELFDRVTLSLRICEQFAVDSGRLVTRPTADLGQAAHRPLRVFLDCAKIRKAGVAPFRDAARGLQSMKAWNDGVLSTVERHV